MWPRGPRRPENLTNGEIIGMRVCLASRRSAAAVWSGTAEVCFNMPRRSHMPGGDQERLPLPAVPSVSHPASLPADIRPYSLRPWSLHPGPTSTTGAPHFTGQGGGDFSEGGGRFRTAEKEDRQDEKWRNYRVGRQTRNVCHNLRKGWGGGRCGGPLGKGKEEGRSCRVQARPQ